MPDATDGAAFGVAVEVVFAPVQQLNQRGAAEAVARIEVGQGRGLCELVPRTIQLTVVAAIDAVADQAAQLHRDAALEFNGEVGDATACIEFVGRDDGLRRTNVNAAAALPAM